MTSFTSILQDIEKLPPDAQKQIFDFVDFIKSRHSPVSETNSDSDYLFGVVHVTRQVSLEQMEDAISEQGQGS